MLITTPDNTPVNVRDKKSVNMANSQKKFVFVRFVSLLAAELFNYPDAKCIIFFFFLAIFHN